jgi:hypothetical protein
VDIPYLLLFQYKDRAPLFLPFYLWKN